MDSQLLASWPIDGLESVPVCPVCGGERRTVLQTDLSDYAYRVAAGKWNLWNCYLCSTVYLDPRPSKDTIHLAYTSYYTHQVNFGKDNFQSLSKMRRIRRSLVNGYSRWRYCSNVEPSSPLGVLAAFAIPPLRSVIDNEYRNLPNMPSGRALLDVGCGDGSFLRLARSCGWEVVGLDPDKKAVETASKQGLTVYEGGIEFYDGKTCLFDVITLSHVIEHVHDPVKVLIACYNLLRPGGQLWVETPNINSYGYQLFKRYWRGLETPRHLVLFNRQSLNTAFQKAGFSTMVDVGSTDPRLWMLKASYAIESGLLPHELVKETNALRWQLFKALFVGLFFPSRREYLTVVAHK